MPDVESKSRTAGWAPGVFASEFEPLPRIGVFQAARRHWLLVLLPIVVLVPVVAILGARRTPTYSAEARLVVGQLNISTPGAIAGYAQAAQDLAATYPLLIYTNGVVEPVARKLHLSPGEVSSSISATEVPNSSVIRVDATTKSAVDAVRLANAASDALVADLVSLSHHDSTLTTLSKQLQRAELAYEHAQAKVPRMDQPLTAQGQKLVARAATARVELNSVIQTYQAAVQNQAVAPNLRTVTHAAGASSDRTSKLQLAIVGALVAGLILGLALATLRANVAVRRALTLPAWDPSTENTFPSFPDIDVARKAPPPSHEP